MINQAEPRGEVEDVGLGEEWRHDEDRNRVPSWPASLVAHKAHLAPLPDDIRPMGIRPSVEDVAPGGGVLPTVGRIRWQGDGPSPQS